MDSKVVINGREALPIRIIPFVTGWMMPPDLTASSLAHTSRICRLEKVVAYHLLADGGLAPMLPKEWDGVEAELEALSDKLRAEENFDNQNYLAWRRESIFILPAGVFVWKDEFEEAFGCAFSEDGPTLIDERFGDRELNLMPWIPPDLREIVVEGFAAARVLPNKEPTTTSSRSYVSNNLERLNQAAEKFWKNADPDDPGTHPVNTTVVAWLEEQGFSSSLAGKAATIIRPDWAFKGRKPEE